MVRRLLVTAGLVAALAVPAFAATTKDATKDTAKETPKASGKTYYAEQSVKTQVCYVVTKKPDGKTATMIGTDSFPSFAKAAAAIKADKTCKTPTKTAATPAPMAAPAPAAPPATAPAQ